MKEFTLVELKQFDGKEGRRAYIGLFGNVYDVTDIDAWKNGIHHKGAAAGNDVTEIFSQSPHKLEGLQKILPLIGTIKD